MKPNPPNKEAVSIRQFIRSNADLLAHRPLILTVAGLATGISAGRSAPLSVILPSFIISLVTLQLLKKYRFAITIFGIAAISGWLMENAATVISPNDASRWIGQGRVEVTGNIVSEPVLRDGRAQAMIAAKSIRDNQDVMHEVTGLLIASLPVQSRSAPSYGAKVRLDGLIEPIAPAGNPNQFDYSRYLARKGIYASIHIKHERNWRILQLNWGNPILAAAYSIRRFIVRQLKSTLTPISASTLSGVMFGLRSDLPPVLGEEFEMTGTVHVLATAGLHVGMVAWLAGRLLFGIGIHRRIALHSLIVVLIFYALMAGARPSVCRAALIAVLFLGGELVDRDGEMANALAAAALVLLLLNPLNLFDTSFQMSFATVMTIVILMPLYRPIRQRFSRSLARWGYGRRMATFALHGSDLVAISIAAQIGAAPLVAVYSNEISLVSIPANALIVPVMPILIALGFIIAPLNAVLPIAAHWAARLLLEPLLAFVVGVVYTASSLNAAVVPTPSPGFWLVALIYAAVWGSAIGLRHRLSGDQLAGDASNLKLNRP